MWAVATVEQVRDAMHKAPFRGFTVKLTDGQRYFVKHPDFISVPSTPRGRDLVIHDEKGTHRIDLLHVVEVEEPDSDETSPAEEPKSEGNGV
jgi:hypothetical protein